MKSTSLDGIFHGILEHTDQVINLHMIEGWEKDSMPQSPIVQKLGIIYLGSEFPRCVPKLGIKIEPFGPYSSLLAESFKRLLESGKVIYQDQDESTPPRLIIQPTSDQERQEYPDINEGFLQSLLDRAQQRTDPFIFLEIMSIIAWQCAIMLEPQDSPFTLSEEDEHRLCAKVTQSMEQIPRLANILTSRNPQAAKEYVQRHISEYWEIRSRKYVRKVRYSQQTTEVRPDLVEMLRENPKAFFDLVNNYLTDHDLEILTNLCIIRLLRLWEGRK